MRLFLLHEGKAISGFPGYTITKSGSISRNGKTIKSHEDEDGYMKVRLYKDGKGYNKYVHKLVAQVFHGDGGKKVVGHKDGKKKNNNAGNLEYQSNSENTQHAYDHGLAKGQKGSDNGKAKLSKSQADSIRRSDKSIYKLADQYGVSAAQISFIKNNKRRKGGV